MSEKDILAGVPEEEACLSVEELCAACSLEREWLVRRIEEGLFPVPGGIVAEWRFGAAGIARARRMRSFERDFDAVPELAALVADMLEEMDELRARLRRAGLA
jgi:chaperone modulatory protein CbpM